MSPCIISHKTSSQLILTRPYIHGVSKNQSIQTSVSSYSRNHYLLVWVIASTGGQLPSWPMRIITKQQPSQTDAFKLSSRKNENFLHRRQAIQYPPANDRSLPAPDQTILLARELGPRYLSSIQYYKYYLLLCTEYCRLTDQMKSCAGLWLLSVLLISLASLYPASSRPPYTRYKSQLHFIDVDI